MHQPEEVENLQLWEEQLDEWKQVIQDTIWIASSTTPFTKESSPIPWIRDNHEVFPTIVRKMLSSETVLNNPEIIGLLHRPYSATHCIKFVKSTDNQSGPVIDILLQCGDHIDNPIEATRACNGFVINCLLQLPIEVFSRSQRETIMKAWPPSSPDPAHKDQEALSYGMASLDPAVLSLKAKMMRLPTLYKVSTPREDDMRQSILIKPGNQISRASGFC